MSAALPVIAVDACWNRIGVRGDRSCPGAGEGHPLPQLPRVRHRRAGASSTHPRRPTTSTSGPPGSRPPTTARPGSEFSVLVFRLGDEWLALPVGVLVEVTRPRPPHRIPHRGGLLAGMVNIRGELHLCVRLDLLLGIAATGPESAKDNPRLIVIRHESEGWAFAADEVDQVHRLPCSERDTSRADACCGPRRN